MRLIQLFLGSLFLMNSCDLLDPWIPTFASPGLLFCTFHLANPCNFLCSWLLISGLLNRLTLLKARLQMGDVDFGHVLQDRHNTGCWMLKDLRVFIEFYRILSFGSFGFWFLCKSWIQVSHLVAHLKARKEVENTIHEILKTCGPPDLRIQQRFEMLIRRLAWQSPFSHEHDWICFELLCTWISWNILTYLRCSSMKCPLRICLH